MRRRLQFRPVGWLVGLSTAAAMAGITVVSASGGAAAAQKEYSATFQAQCMLAPGLLNEPATVQVSTRSTGPAETFEGQQVTFDEASVKLTTPASWSESFAALQTAQLRGKLTSFELDATGLEPAALNIATPSEFPEGLPFVAPIERESSITFTAPAGSISSYGPFKTVPTPASNAKLEVNSEAAFRETESGSGNYEATGKGIVLELEGLNAEGVKKVGPITAACTAPKGVVVAEIPIVLPPSTSATTTTCDYFPDPTPIINSIEPSHGPESGGTSVTITGGQFGVPGHVTSVLFGGKNATSFHVNSQSSITAIAPPGSGTVGVVVVVEAETPVPACNAPLIGASNSVPFTYTAAVYERWQVSGSLADARLGQPITLPEGSTFSGSAALNRETGAGSVNGQLSIPDFTNTFKLFGALPVTLGISLAETAPLEGSVSSAQAPSGDESLSMPLRLNLGITSVALLGLSIPTQCATVEPLALELADTLTAEELLKSGWSFTGTSSVPRFECHGGWLGHLFGAVLSALLSGPDNTYALSVRPAG